MYVKMQSIWVEVQLAKSYDPFLVIDTEQWAVGCVYTGAQRQINDRLTSHCLGRGSRFTRGAACRIIAEIHFKHPPSKHLRLPPICLNDTEIERYAHDWGLIVSCLIRPCRLPAEEEEHCSEGIFVWTSTDRSPVTTSAQSTLIHSQ